jgi:hypothetical protein
MTTPQSFCLPQWCGLQFRPPYGNAFDTTTPSSRCGGGHGVPVLVGDGGSAAGIRGGGRRGVVGLAGPVVRRHILAWHSCRARRNRGRCSVRPGRERLPAFSPRFRARLRTVPVPVRRPGRRPMRMGDTGCRMSGRCRGNRSQATFLHGERPAPPCRKPARGRSATEAQIEPRKGMFVILILLAILIACSADCDYEQDYD